MLTYVLAALVVVLLVVLWWWRQRVGSKPPETRCGNWNAWDDRIPGPGKKPNLHVTGECSFPTAGYAVELRRHAPQGINPAYLLLDKIIRGPGGPVPQVVTVVKIAYAEATNFKYAFVTILPDQVTVPVQEVQ